jgi:predicted NBD/HSP70 family sugar kinase
MIQISDRIANRKAKDIFSLIRRQGVVSKSDLKEQCGLTVSTLTRLLEELTNQRLILEVGYGESTGGRRPTLYQVNPRYAYVLGLDISRVQSKLILCDMHLQKLESRSWDMTEEMTPERLIDEVTAATKMMLHNQGVDRASILGMGIGGVGPLDRMDGTILEPQFFPAAGWNHVHICQELEKTLKIPVFLDNGANAAILGEYWFGSGLVDKYEHLLYIHAGVGIRSSVIANGKIVYGAVDMEGAVGQMIIQTDGRPHRISGGNYGSWESYASIYALEESVKASLKLGRASILQQMAKSADSVTFPLILQALQQQDPLAVELYTQAATYFGIGLANLLNILHPEKVILGGPLVAGHDLFFRIATQTAIMKTYHYPAYQVVFSKSKLAEDAVAVGAAVMVINKLTE